MKVKLLSLIIDMTPELAEVETNISEKISKTLDSYVNFDNYYKEKDFVNALATSFNDYDTILLFTEKPVYLKFKPFLDKIFKFKSKENKNLSKLIKQNYPEMDNKDIKRHATFPVGAQVLDSPDGLFSAYMMKSSSQTIIIMPLDEESISTSLDMYVLPDLKQMIAQKKIDELERQMESEETVIQNEEESLPDEEETQDLTDQPINEDSTEEEPTIEQEENDDIPEDVDPEQLLIQLCRTDLKTISLADTNTVDFIRKKTNANQQLKDIVIYSDYLVKNEFDDNVEYCKQLAYGAHKASSADIGLAITNVYAYSQDGQKNYYILIAAYNGEKYWTDRIDATAQIPLPMFIENAVNNLFELAIKAIVGLRKGDNKSIADLQMDNESSDNGEKKSKKRSRKNRKEEKENKKAAKKARKRDKKEKSRNKSGIGQKLAILFAILCFLGAIAGSVLIFLKYM